MGDAVRGKKKNFHHPLVSPRGPGNHTMMHDLPRPPRSSLDSRPSSQQVRSHHLIDESIEKFVNFAGIIDEVPPDLDVTNRTPVLRLIDQSKQNGIISPPMSQHPATISLSVYHVKISRRNHRQDLIVRIPIHEVASICYIKDDGVHILAVKFGTPESCKLAVLYCEQQLTAEEICSLVGQCFHLVYTSDTIDMMDQSIRDSDASSPDSTMRTSFRPQFITGSETDMTSADHRQPGTRYSDPDSSSLNSQTAKELLAEYMQKLKERLTQDELYRFASLLKRKNLMPFAHFCEALLELYGPDKKFLLSEMSPFIPNDNYQEFDRFLQKNGIKPSESFSTRSSLPNRGIRRSVSELSTTSTLSNTVNGAEDFSFEHLMEHISDQVAEMSDSVDIDTNPASYVPVPVQDYT